MVRSLLLCCLCRRFCHLLVVVVVAVIVVIFVIVVVVVAMAAVARAGARARGEQRQQQHQCRALGVRTIPPGTIKMILCAEEERLLAGCRGGMRSGGRCPGQLQLPEVRVKAGGSSLSRCFCLRGGWGGRWQAGRRWQHGDGPPAPRMLELG